MNDLAYAKEWIKYAERDYASAKHLESMHPVPYEVICYLSQQSVEKSLKAILVYHVGDAPKIHDLVTLKNLCQKHTDKIHIDDKIAAVITKFASASRYPDEVYDFTEEETKLGLRYAKQVLEQAKQIIT